MDLFGRQARQRQQALVTALQNSAPAPVATAGPPQPTAPDHPGSNAYPNPAAPQVQSWRIWHFKFFAIYPTNITYLIPIGPVPSGGFPVIAISPGKFLDNPTNYTWLLQHICKKGYIVLFVDADTGPLDCEHTRMAREFLEAVSQTIKKKLNGPTTNPNQIGWWGHSMGAKVQAIAAQLTDNPYYQTPTAVLANNFSNEKALCNDDALSTAARIPATIWYSIIRGDQDTIAKDDPQKLYAALNPAIHRQLLEVISYPDDKLIADHLAPTNDTLIGGELNALDWWLYWKIAVGAFDFHFKNKAKKWAYGEERENGGIDAARRQIKHKVEAQSGI